MDYKIYALNIVPKIVPPAAQPRKLQKCIAKTTALKNDEHTMKAQHLL